MNDQPDFATSPFDAICQTDEQGNEYWSARDLYKILGYTQWRNFQSVVVKRAMKACEENGRDVSDHFVQSYKVIQHGKGSAQSAVDIRLSRYAAYLTVMNGDPNMPIVAMGQEYFAEQTRRQEIADQMAALPEEPRRLLYRARISMDNQRLNEAAREAGVISPGDFATFTNHGYRGLYNGETENMIHARKKLAENERILDFMGSEELGDNIFRAVQTDAKLRRENIKGKSEANQTHLEVGKEVRETIKRLGGTMPEDLPTPTRSIQQLQREEQMRVEQSQQPPLFPL